MTSRGIHPSLQRQAVLNMASGLYEVVPGRVYQVRGYDLANISFIKGTALTAPPTLQLPFASWTLDRLTTYLNEQCQIAIKRSRISEILIAEGLRWRTHETWFSARVDPEFAEKKRPLKNSIPRRPRAVS